MALRVVDKLRRKWTELTDPASPPISCVEIVEQIKVQGEMLYGLENCELFASAAELRSRANFVEDLSQLLPEVYAVTRELAHRLLGMRPYEVQLMAAIGLHGGKLVEMQTGEGKTLAAVMPAVLHALTGKGVHILTFNDYLAARDATGLKLVYQAFGLSVGVVQEGMDADSRWKAYAADVIYATAKEAGFDFLRDGLARHRHEVTQRPFHFAIIDEADSILIDEARVPLVIAAAHEISQTNFSQVAVIVRQLERGKDWEIDEHARNVQLTMQGAHRVESLLSCGSLHLAENTLLLAQVNQALHAQVLLNRDVDYIVRDGRIAVVDELTGRVVADRRWPDGLQNAVEAKENLVIQPSGRILGSITLQHFLAQYPSLAGMTATAQSADVELEKKYGLQVLPIPSNRPSIREDLPDHIFTHRLEKEQAIIEEITLMHDRGRPVLVGTSSVEESEFFSVKLGELGIPCRVLNAKDNAAESEIIANAGAIGAVTISTNMAGRGTDIRLGGADEQQRERVVVLGGLFVIGTNRHESRRVDDQLRGRAGRQGDPGSTRFFVSLEDPLMVRFGIENLIPRKLRPERMSIPVGKPMVRREVERLQRIVEGQNEEIRTTLERYSAIVERQRKTLFEWRSAVLHESISADLFSLNLAERYSVFSKVFGVVEMEQVERAITLHHIDYAWAEHLAFVAEIREGIHLVGIGGMDPLSEFEKRVAPAFGRVHHEIENRIVESLSKLALSASNCSDSVPRGPSSTWTYLVHDRAVTDLHRMLHGPGSTGAAAMNAIMIWPLFLAREIWQRLLKYPKQ